MYKPKTVPVELFFFTKGSEGAEILFVFSIMFIESLSID